MQTPLQLTFRSMPHSDSIAAHIQARAEKLERLCDRVVSCHVVVALAGHHHRNGDRFHVSINLGLPGHELVVNHDAADARQSESVSVAADHAFDEAERQLEGWVDRQRVRRHEGGADSRDPALR